MRSDSSSRACRVTLSDFEGPLDLLLYLIRRDELDITLIQVSMVAGQYLAYIRDATELNLDVAGEYLVMAATLTRLKSRSLLPSRREGTDESDDPERALLRQLILYRAFKEVAADLRENEEVWRDAFSPPGERQRFTETAREFPDNQSGSLMDLLEALESLARKGEPAVPHMIERPVLSMAECMDIISRAMPPGAAGRFTDILGEKPDRRSVVSFFIAVLELVRRGWMNRTQDYPFSEIRLERTRQWA